MKPVWKNYREWEDYKNGMYQNGNDEEIATNLGMDSDEVLRLKQISGLKEAFLGKEFSKSWEEFEHKHFDENGEYIEGE